MTEPSRYRLVRTIASGGMASVYEAVAQGERGFERRVAIKRVLPQHAEDESVRRMFFDEARIASQLHHASVVQVLDYGVVDGDDFIVMEYVDGIDAEKAVGRASQRGERMDEGLALHVTAEIAHALDYAHRLAGEDGEPLGIVHRDVSPHNVLLSWEGDVKLSDFGIALATQREERTRTGVVKGKMSYMPLEQAVGKRVTGAADVYALGATLHTLLSGGPPSSDPRHEPEIDASISAPTRELISSCMAREPAERPEAEEVALRAGKLAAVRLERDARGALREWLAPLRDATGTVKALDDLMGLALVQSGEGRHFTVSREAADAVERRSAVPTEAATPSGKDPDQAPGGGTEPSIHLPTRGRPRALVAALGIVAVGAAAAIGVTYLDGERDENAPALAAAEPEAAEPPPEDGPSPEEQPADEAETAAAAVSEDAETADHAPTETPRPRVRSGPRTVTESPEPETAETPSVPREEPTEPEASPAITWLRVPRGSAGQERVVLDGTARGFTPTVLRVPAGDHRLTIHDAETDAVLLERTVTTAEHHTRTAPMVVAR